MSYQHISAKERTTLMYLLQMRKTQREIAEHMGRSPSTISREIRRNWPVWGNHYHDFYAQKQASDRLKSPRHQRRKGHEALTRYVDEKLKEKWPPEVISERLKKDHPADESMRVSPEQIYQWVFADARLGGQLFCNLRRSHKRRRRQGRLAYAKRGIPGRIDITERPAIVDERQRLGDWEGDTIAGKVGTGVIATHIDRRSGFLVAVKLASKQAEHLASKTVSAFEHIPANFRQTMTYDNGTEFARFKHIEQHSGFSVYFAKPYSPWQRGCNENANGLLRQFFPKGSDFRAIDDEHVSNVANLLNHRPRKRLDYRTPYEVFYDTDGVALAS